MDSIFSIKADFFAERLPSSVWYCGFEIFPEITFSASETPLVSKPWYSWSSFWSSPTYETNSDIYIYW